MKKRRFLTLALALLLVFQALICCASCAKKPETLLSFTADGKTYTLSVNAYKLLLARTKGTLIASGYTANGHTADTDGFWAYTDKFDGKVTTLDDYYKDAVLKNCKTYLVGLYLFDKNGMSLTDEEKAKIDDVMNELVLTDGDGSKTKLNDVLADYGVNYDILKDVLTMTAKVSHLVTTLGNNLGDNLKSEYLNENYVHFYQVFYPNYRYLYETDENGDVIYYDDENDTVKYAVTGFYTTVDGKTVYYTDSTHTHVSYDKVNGTPAYRLDQNGAYVTEELTEQELAALQSRVQEELTVLTAKDADAFKTAALNDENNVETAAYTDGYYLNKNAVYANGNAVYRYLDDIVSWLKTANEGETKLFTSDFGYHVVKKYACTDKAWEKTENTVWFTEFLSSLSEEYFDGLCADHLDDVTVDADVLAKVPAVKDLLPDYYY